MTKITQAMILAAGKGTRMRPLTLTKPKPLVMVGDKPLIVWHIERLVQAGVQNIVINVGYLGEVVKAFFAQNDFGVKITISDETVFAEPLETAGGIKYALDTQLLADEPFILINGDVWTDYDLSRLSGHELGGSLAHLILTPNPEHNLTGDFSLIDGFAAQKSDSLDNFTFSGLSVLSPKLLSEVPRTPTPLAPYLKNAMNDKTVTASLMDEDDIWIDVGTLQRLDVANEVAKNRANNTK